jgi:glycyl-tRNA synthetase beta chain
VLVNLPLTAVFARSGELLGLSGPKTELLSYIVERLKTDLRGSGNRPDLIAAAFSQAEGATAEDNLNRLLSRVGALNSFIDSDDGRNLLTAYRRASNIVAIEERKDGRSYPGVVDPMLLNQPEEQNLYRCLELVGHRAKNRIAKEDFRQAMLELAALREPVDEFFDKVTVNTNEPRLRENRLRLLSRIRETMNQVADFSQIEG